MQQALKALRQKEGIWAQSVMMRYEMNKQGTMKQAMRVVWEQVENVGINHHKAVRRQMSCHCDSPCDGRNGIKKNASLSASSLPGTFFHIHGLVPGDGRCVAVFARPSYG